MYHVLALARQGPRRRRSPGTPCPHQDSTWIKTLDEPTGPTSQLLIGRRAHSHPPQQLKNPPSTPTALVTDARSPSCPAQHTAAQHSTATEPPTSCATRTPNPSKLPLPPSTAARRSIAFLPGDERRKKTTPTSHQSPHVDITLIAVVGGRRPASARACFKHSRPVSYPVSSPPLSHPFPHPPPTHHHRSCAPRPFRPCCSCCRPALREGYS